MNNDNNSGTPVEANRPPVVLAKPGCYSATTAGLRAIARCTVPGSDAAAAPSHSTSPATVMMRTAQDVSAAAGYQVFFRQRQSANDQFRLNSAQALAEDVPGSRRAAAVSATLFTRPTALMLSGSATVFVPPPPPPVMDRNTQLLSSLGDMMLAVGAKQRSPSATCNDDAYPSQPPVGVTPLDFYDRVAGAPVSGSSTSTSHHNNNLGLQPATLSFLLPSRNASRLLINSSSISSTFNEDRIREWAADSSTMSSDSSTSTLSLASRHSIVA